MKHKPRIKLTRKNIRVSKQKRRTPEEWSVILERFHLLKEEVYSSTDYLRSESSAGAQAAKRLHVSQSSIYRWQRVLADQGPSKLAVLSPDVFKHLISESAVRRIEAALRLACWMRWPIKPKEQQIGFLACVVCYLGQTQLDASLAKADSELANVLKNETTLGLLRQLMLGDASIPMFELIPYRETGWDDLEVFVDTVSYLLSHSLEQTSLRTAPSLNKAAYLVDQGMLRTEYTARTFLSYWQEMGAAAPFWYVARRHSVLDWALNPIAHEFSAAVDSLIADPEALSAFVANCRWAVEEIQSILPKRSSLHTNFPVFPPTIVKKAVPVMPLSEAVRNRLTGYKT